MERAYALEKSVFDHTFPFISCCLDILTVFRLRLALVQMKLVLGMVLNKFSVTVDNLQNEDEMEGLQMAVLAPKGGWCLLRFSNHRKTEEA
jgi:hypothetical protein